MEDMRRLGYAGVCSTREPVDRQHCEKALAAIARFHSASIISERSSKRSLREAYPEAMFENVFSKEVKFSRFVHFGLISAHDLVPHMPEYKGKDPTVIKAVQEKVMGFVEQVMGFIERNGDTLHVMCHGDPWISNFIFKYEDNVPTKALLIDFQMLRYAPPGRRSTFYSSCTNPWSLARLGQSKSWSSSASTTTASPGNCWRLTSQ